MGKTFKHGYLSIGNSFNSLQKRKHNKRYDRRKRKLDFKNERSWLVEYCESPGITFTISQKHLEWRRCWSASPKKIGYCLNTSYDLNYIENYIYGEYSSYNKNVKYPQSGYKNFCERKKVSILLSEMNDFKIKCGNVCWINKYISHLNKMNKQLYRRGKIGYFRGHKCV